MANCTSKVISRYSAARFWLWDEAYETIEPGAFDGQTAEDVCALVNHDTTLVLGRTTAGTLELRQDEKGLGAESRLTRQIRTP